jgi:hypothetical protein
MFHKRLWLFAAIILMLAASISTFANENNPTTTITPADLKNIMLVRDIKPGMIGYGKTVFEGTKISTFKVQVLGVLKKINMGTDLILVKMSGGPMTEDGANTIQGMSGSPVYINGKLIGAFAYGQAFIKEPIGMITPIQYMLEAWDPNLPSKPSSFTPFIATELDKPIAMDGRSFSKVLIDNGDPSTPASTGDDTMVFRPLGMPISVSGMSPHIMAYLQDALRPLNLYPIAGTGPVADKKEDVQLQPGAAIGVSLVTGDVDFTGIGTVTYRRGNRILAFGHPMISSEIVNGLDGIGPLDAPMTTAFIYGVSPSVYLSSKDGGPMKIVGRLLQDRPWCISGEIGAKPKMIPVTVHINDTITGRKNDFHVDVVNHPLLSTPFILATVSQGIYNVRGTPNDATAKVKFEIDTEGLGKITRENTFYDSVGIEMASTKDLQSIMGMLQYNKFHTVGLKSVNVWVDITPKHSSARIEGASISKTKFAPGEKVDVAVSLRQYDQDPFTRTVSLQLPANLPNGTYSLQVRGGPAPTSGLDGVIPPQLQALIGGGTQSGANPENLRQVIDKWLEREKNNDLVARIALPKSVPSIAGQKLTGMPAVIADVMKAVKNSTTSTDKEEIKSATPMDWVIQGSQSLTITVQKPDKTEKKTAKKPETPAPSSADSSDAPSYGSDDGEPTLGATAMAFMPQYDIPPFPVNLSSEKPLPSGAPAITPTTTTIGTSGKSTDGKTGSKTGTASDEKTVVRQVTTWTQTTKSDFLNGTFNNTAVTNADLVTMLGSLKHFCDTGETFVWSTLADGKGNVYLGTGNSGIIYKSSADGKMSVFYKSGELEIQSMAMDSSGNIYAGTSPNGKIFKIDPAGKGTLLFSAPEKYITALAFDRTGDLYAATGDKCKVYKIAPAGTVTTALDTSEDSALSLAIDSANNVFVGTAPNGLIYRISPNGASSVFYDAPEDSVSALAIDSKGTLYAGTAPKGVIYKFMPGNIARTLTEKAGKSIMSMSADAQGNIYAVSTNLVYKVFPDETIATIDNPQDIQFLTGSIGGNKLYLGTENEGSVYQADIAGLMDATYESPIHDCTTLSRWGTISWASDTPKGSQVSVQTRTGTSGQPDATWSSWSPVITQPGSRILNPTGRFIQYRASLHTDKPSSEPKLQSVSITYLTKNQAPNVNLTSPKGGEFWSKTKTIKWTGTDPDKDTLTYQVQYSTDGGTNWKALEGKTTSNKTPAGKPDEPKPSTAPATDPSQPTTVSVSLDPTSANPEQDLADLQAALKEVPDLDQASKDVIIAEANRMVNDQQSQETLMLNADASDKPSTTKDTSLSWDTTKFKDGSYLIKVIASDKLSNPTDALSDFDISKPIMVVNTPPTIMTFSRRQVIAADRTVHIEGIAEQKLISITAVQYRTDTGDWTAATPNDGMFDSNTEGFSFTTDPLSKGEHNIEIKAFDQAGNTSSTKVKVKTL